MEYIEKENLIEDEFMLPKCWCVLRNEENYQIINNYFKIEFPQHLPPCQKVGYIGISTFMSSWSTFTHKEYEITFEQFKKYVLKEKTVVEEVKVIEPIIKNKTEMEIWLENTKSLNLSLIDLINYIGSNETCNFANIFDKLEGKYSEDKAKILFNKWNNQIIEPLPQFKVIESIETITKVENNEGNQFFIDDRIKTPSDNIYTIKGFKYNVDKSNILAIVNNNTVISIDKIEHYIEPKVEVKEEFVLPEKWYIKITDDSLETLNKYRLQIFKRGIFGPLPTKYNYTYMCKDGSGDYNPSGNYTEITFDQFKKYVLKEEFKEETLLEKAKIIEYLHDFKIGDKIKSKFYNINEVYTITNIKGDVLFYNEISFINKNHSRVLAKNAIKVN